MSKGITLISISIIILYSFWEWLSCRISISESLGATAASQEMIKKWENEQLFWGVVLVISFGIGLFLAQRKRNN